jgi:hypothetical protein
MDDYEFTVHSADMLSERTIPIEWIFDTLNEPDKIEYSEENTVHYIKTIKEFGSRYLRVIVNPITEPKKIITFFFDRRIKGLK